jgi:anti-sigma-K factor RskA
MRWPKPDELQRLSADDRTVFRNWRRAVFGFYAIAVTVVVLSAILAAQHNRPEPGRVVNVQNDTSDSTPVAVIDRVH